MSGRSKLLLHWCIFNTVMWIPFIVSAYMFEDVRGILVMSTVTSLVSCLALGIMYDKES